MNYDTVRFERGQLWMVRFKQEEAVGHEMKKDRPYLVLSVGRYNKSSGMVTMVPVTSAEKPLTVSQVPFTNYRGAPNIILCEQIRSFDYMSGSYLFDFIGNVSNEVLEKVDVALSIHLGMHYSPITLNNLYKTMESIISSVGYMQRKADTPKFTDEDVQKFTEKLKELAVKDGIIEEDTDTAPVEETIEYNVCEYKEPSLPTKDVIKNVEVKPKKRIKWDEKTRQEFLKDCDTMTVEEVMKKWSIEKRSRFHSMKNYVNSLNL